MNDEKDTFVVFGLKKSMYFEKKLFFPGHFLVRFFYGLFPAKAGAS